VASKKLAVGAAEERKMADFLSRRIFTSSDVHENLMNPKQFIQTCSATFVLNLANPYIEHMST